MIKTERTNIIPFDMKFLEEYFKGFDAEITKYQWPDPFDNRDTARDVLQGFIDEMNSGASIFCSILSNGGRFIGGVEVHGLDGDCPELGIWIVPSEQKKGYAYEVLDAVLEYVVENNDKKEFFYEADVRNSASTKLLHKFMSKYDITDEGVEKLVTDSDKELEMQAHILRRSSVYQELDQMKRLGRTEIVTTFYEKADEDRRLEKRRQGQLEYFVTMNYIHKFIKEGDRVLEIGAGTGRYSIALAKKGYRVSAIELVEKNLKELRQNADGLTNIEAFQGDALDLERFEDNTFDVTLSFGPMYHLYDAKDQHKALDEAIRVTKPGGVILVAFLSAHAIICTNYLYDFLPTTVGIKENFDKNYNVKHFKEQLFTGFDICEFEGLFEHKSVDHITTVAADNVLEIAEARPDFQMSDEDFKAFADYQMHICEKREMLGTSSHLLYICRKESGVGL